MKTSQAVDNLLIEKHMFKYQKYFQRICLRVVALLWVASGLFFATEAKAGFIGSYTIGNFTLINTNADGTLDSSGAPSSIMLTGGNNGTGNPGTTDLTVAAAASGFVSFQFGFSTPDSTDFDSAGYLLNGVFTLFPSLSGTAIFSVVQSDIFGFRVATADNTGEPGVLTISNFNGPEAVPEPAYSVLVALCLTAFVLRQLRIRAGSR